MAKAEKKFGYIQESGIIGLWALHDCCAVHGALSWGKVGGARGY